MNRLWRAARSLRATDIVFMALWLFVVANGMRTIRGVTAPFDLDSYRDLSIAQGMLDGDFVSDPYYAGAAGWYNPLIAAIVAGVSWLGHIPLPQADVLLGPVLNALGPVCFFLLVRRLIEPAAALFAGIAFLLMPANVPPWGFATYTPWLFAYVAAQALVYSGLLLWERELRRHSMSVALAVGILLGLTFLAHTAPALLFGTIVLMTSIHQLRRHGEYRSPLIAAAVVYVTGAIVSSPFWLPILVKYRFHIINRIPTTFTFDGARPSQLLASNSPALSAVMAAVVGLGLVEIWRSKRDGRMLLLCWVGVAAAMYGLGRAAELTGSFAVLPAYHLFFQLRAACWALFGAGAATALSAAIRRFPLSARASQFSRVAAAGALVATLIPAYRHRDAFTTARAAALGESHSSNRRLTEWIRRNTPDAAVFLASNGDGLTTIGPANRQVVALDPFFSNPYLDYGMRSAERDAMFAALASAQNERFRQLASKYEVSYVLARGEQAAALLRAANSPVIAIYGQWDAMVFRVRR